MSEKLFDALADYEVDHLLLLVGGNPLPNAVAGPLLVKEGGRITLLHTGPEDDGGTETIAREALAPVLQLRVQHRSVTVHVHDEIMNNSRVSSIRTQVYAALDALPEAKTIGLHYTAGTKAMSVHSHRFIEIWADDNSKPKPIRRLSSARATFNSILIPMSQEAKKTGFQSVCRRLRYRSCSRCIAEACHLRKMGRQYRRRICRSCQKPPARSFR